MENHEVCPLSAKCTVFREKIFHNEMVGITYRKLYCLQTNRRYKECKRYQVFERTGIMVPYYVLPNSTASMVDLVSLAEANFRPNLSGKPEKVPHEF